MKKVGLIILCSTYRAYAHREERSRRADRFKGVSKIAVR